MQITLVKNTITTAKKMNSYKSNSLRCKKVKPHTPNKAPKKVKINPLSNSMFDFTSSFLLIKVS